MPEKPTLIGLILCVPVYFHESVRENHLLIKPKGEQPPVVFELQNEDMMFKLETRKPPLVEVEYMIGTSKDLQYYQDFADKYTSYDPDWKMKLQRYEEIYKVIKEAGIELIGRKGSNPILADKTCKFEMEQNIAAWDIYSVEEVTKMIIKARDEHKLKKENNVNEN